MGGTLSNQTINDLPLNGRNYINLLTLRPGMTVYPGGGSASRSANGTRPEDIGYLLDGVREDDPYTGSSVLNAVIPAGDASTSLPIDAIQEFNTEQNPKAEFGWKPGAIVNAGIKSGTNTIHGTAFAFGRRNCIGRAQLFPTSRLPPVRKLEPVHLRQGARGLGSTAPTSAEPLKKDKLFYFVNYEGQSYSVGSTLLLTPPLTVTTPGGPNPSKSLVDACNAIGFANVTPLSAQLAGLNPDCSVKPTNLTPGTSESLFPTNTSSTPLPLGLVSTNTQENGVVKIDYHINESERTFRALISTDAAAGSGTTARTKWGFPGQRFAVDVQPLWNPFRWVRVTWTWTPKFSARQSTSRGQLLLPSDV